MLLPMTTCSRPDSMCEYVLMDKCSIDCENVISIGPCRLPTRAVEGNPCWWIIWLEQKYRVTRPAHHLFVGRTIDSWLGEAARIRLTGFINHVYGRSNSASSELICNTKQDGYDTTEGHTSQQVPAVVKPPGDKPQCHSSRRRWTAARVLVSSLDSGVWSRGSIVPPICFFGPTDWARYLKPPNVIGDPLGGT